jgi:hypothetical protein
VSARRFRALSRRRPLTQALGLLKTIGYHSAMKFTWDARKAAANLRKHGGPFGEVSTVISDPDHSI